MEAIGTLYLLATPLGNLADLSPRAREVLAQCDLVAAEDTRVVSRLLAALGISGKPLVSVREHNERRAAASLARKHAGARIVCVSDAGTPAVADPGATLVRHLREAGFATVPIPGASAVSAAVSVAGLGSDGYVFAGFPPRQAKGWDGRLRELAASGLPVVIFEAPGRVATTLARLAATFGDGTEVCLCRELTKQHEQVVAGDPATLAAAMAAGDIPARGEFTLVVSFPPAASAGSAEAVRVLRLLAAELPPAKAAKLAARITGTDSRQLYAQLAGADDER